MRLAVIDLGTNTFHMLVAEPLPEGGFFPLCRERRFVKLADEGIHRIGEAPFARGIETMKAFRCLLDQYGVERVRAFGTAALRTASNGPDFIRQVRAQTGIEVELISGETEAHFICRGVQEAIPFGADPKLIMDIGGGSVEFIIADFRQIHWVQSFPIGVSVLHRNFRHGEPISGTEQARLEAFLQEQLQPLKQALPLFEVQEMVGVSGTFDVLENILGNTPRPLHHTVVEAGRILPLFRQIVRANLEQRLAMPGIPAYRADMIVVAMILIRQVLQLANFRNILVSHYDMKEGMLVDLMERVEQGLGIGD